MISQEVIAALLSWAVMLSGYPAPVRPPTIEYAPHAYFVRQACGGRECGAIGWYDNHGTIYIDRRLEDQDTAFTRGLMVHEIVHYLQDLSGRYDPTSCADHHRREREAYAVQREFIARAYGQAAFLRMRLWEC